METTRAFIQYFTKAIVPKGVLAVETKGKISAQPHTVIAHIFISCVISDLAFE